MLYLLLLLLLTQLFFLLPMFLSYRDCQPSGETDYCAEILRGLLRLDPPAAFLRVLAVIVESGGNAQRRAYPSRRRMAIA